MISKSHQLIRELNKYSTGAISLNKLMFYFDAFHYLEFGETFTGLDYVALPKGPVVDNYREIFPAAKAHPSGTDCPDITDDKRELIKQMLSYVDVVKADAVTALSHQNLGWIAAKDKGNGTKISMFHAIQQLPDDDDDTWLNAPFTVEEKQHMGKFLRGELNSELIPFDDSIYDL